MVRADGRDDLLPTTTAPPGGGAGGRTLLDALRRVVDYEAAWLAVADPVSRTYRCVAHVGTDAVAALPRQPAPLDAPGARTGGPPSAGTVVRLGLEGRDVGLLVLRLPQHRPRPDRGLADLHEMAPLLAQSVDPLRPVLAAAHLVPHVTGGALLTVDGGCLSLPGLAPDPLLAPGSPVTTAARRQVEEGALSASFLWPLSSPGAPAHVRITVVAAPADAPPGSTAVVTSSRAARLRGLTPRELVVLGLLVEGCSNHEIARTLCIAPRTVAAHLEHVLAKLDAPTRTLAAVRAQQRGLYVPVPT